MKPYNKLISIVLEQRNTRAVNAKQAKIKPAEHFHTNNNLKSELPEIWTPGPAKQRHGHPSGCKHN